MKKIILGFLAISMCPLVWGECSVARDFNLTGVSSSGSLSNLVTLDDQKVTSFTQADLVLESKAEMMTSRPLPTTSSIVAFEYITIIPSNLSNQEVAGGWLSNYLSDSESPTPLSGSLFAPTSDKNGQSMILVGVGEPTPLYPSQEIITNGNNRIGIYINRKSKQIGYILNGVNKGYKWSFNDSMNRISFMLLNGFEGFTSKSENIGKEVSMELITDHSSLQYSYPSGATDICGGLI